MKADRSFNPDSMSDEFTWTTMVSASEQDV